MRSHHKAPQSEREAGKLNRLKDFALTRRGMATIALSLVAAAAAVHGPARSVSTIKHNTLDKIQKVDNSYFTEAGIDGQSISVADLEYLKKAEKQEGGRRLAEFKEGLSYLSTLDSKAIASATNTDAKLELANQLYGAVNSVDKSYYHGEGDQWSIVEQTLSDYALEALSHQGIVFRDSALTNADQDNAKDPNLNTWAGIYAKRDGENRVKVVISLDQPKQSSETGYGYTDQEVSQGALMMEEMLKNRRENVGEESNTVPQKDPAPSLMQSRRNLIPTFQE